MRPLNPKFDHKLHFIDAMTRGPTERHLVPERSILVGDLNIAPLETDVWSHKALLKVVSHTPIEVEAFGRMQAAGGWVDAMRERIPPSEKLFTWWSYRSPDWAAADKGRRLDHVWLSPDLRGDLGDIQVFREARGLGAGRRTTFRSWPNSGSIRSEGAEPLAQPRRPVAAQRQGIGRVGIEDPPHQRVRHRHHDTVLMRGRGGDVAGPERRARLR